MNILVFDIETIPDVESARRLYDLHDLNDRDAAEVMFSQRRQETGGSNEFLRHHLHKVVAISVVLHTADKLSVWSLGERNSPEKELVQRFYDGIERYTPLLVSWNGRGFDLPVLHYRALLHGISAPRYWETGEEDQSFRWNNYLNRFHERHTDLMDVLSGYEGRAVASLADMANILGFPGKMGMSGDKVWDCFINGDIESIRNYCETDVLNTYLIFLRYELMRGRQTRAGYDAECHKVRDMLKAEKKPHLAEFLKAWRE
ncbi:MAG: 3'-5' exonuclease [Gammaproteobacteria bacterium]|nr:3'-5' exonuclease [Gammaproteobacteria bacterium]